MNTRIRRRDVPIGLPFALSPLGWAKTRERVAKRPDEAAAVSPSSPSEGDRVGHAPRGKISDRFPNIVLRTQLDEPVRFYDDLVKDKIVIINFMYTTCTDVCPGIGANLVNVHELLGHRVGRDVHMLSISIEPHIDTPDILKRYWKAFGSKPGWLYLTGDYDEIDALRHSLGVYDLDPVIDADKTQHSGIITFGNDRTNRWAALPALMDPAGMVETILRITRDAGAVRGARRAKPRRATPKLYRGRGFIRGVDAERRQVVIDHEQIPGLMMAMTMGFDVPDRTLLEGLAVGQPVDFRVQHTQGRYRIVEIDVRELRPEGAMRKPSAD